MIDRLLGALAPHRCYSCGEIGDLFCESCKYDIIDDPVVACLACATPAQSDTLCGRCRPGYSRGWIVSHYQSPVGEMIKGMKFIGIPRAARVGGELLALRLPRLPDNLRIVPLPTITPHRRWRGFDHTLLTAQELSRRTGRPVDRRLKRKANTVQHGKNLRERQQQATLAYTATGQCDKDPIYLLVDDVVTTGSSLRAAAKCLRQAGANEIWAASLTRETLDQQLF